MSLCLSVLNLFDDFINSDGLITLGCIEAPGLRIMLLGCCLPSVKAQGIVAPASFQQVDISVLLDRIHASRSFYSVG